MLLILVVVLSVILVALSLYRRSVASCDFYKIPGPPSPSLLFGHALELGKPTVHRTLLKWAETYKGIFGFTAAGNKIVVVTDPLLILQTLKQLPKSPIYNALNFIASPDNIPSFFSTSDELYWRTVRKGCAPAFSTENIKKTFPLVVNAVADMCSNFKQEIKAGKSDFLIETAAQQITLDVIGLVGFNHDFQTRRGKQCDLFDCLPPALAEFSMMIGNPLRLPLFRLFPFLPNARTYFKNCRKAHGVLYMLLKKIRQTDVEAELAAGNPTLRTCLASLKDPTDSSKLMSDKYLIPNIATFLVAGFDTTSTAISWALYDLARHPAHQQEVYQEFVDTGLAGDGALRPVEFNDLNNNLPKLSRAFKESMRLHAVAGTGSGRIVPKGQRVNLGGYTLPPDTMVWIPFFASMVCSFNFIQAEEYWPERWEMQQHQQKREQQEKKQEPLTGEPTAVGNSLAPELSYHPFSLGPKDCIGQSLAIMEAKAVLVGLLSRFRFEVSPEMGSVEDVKRDEAMKLTLQTHGGIRLVLTLRERLCRENVPK